MLESHGTLVVPTPVLVETITGDAARDAEVNRVLNVLARIGSIYVSPDEHVARRAGQLRYRAKTDDGVDALVAAEALRQSTPCVVLTSDPDDLRRLLAEAPQVAIREV